jgi:hypothetical protein
VVLGSHFSFVTARRDFTAELMSLRLVFVEALSDTTSLATNFSKRWFDPRDFTNLVLKMHLPLVSVSGRIACSIAAISLSSSEL